MLEKREQERLFSISEVAEQLGVSSSTIRKWEESMNGALPRRVVGSGNQRVYSVEDVVVLRKIVELRDEGFSPEQIGIFLNKFPVQAAPSAEVNGLYVEKKDLQEILQEATRLMKGYVDEKFDAVNQSVGQAVDRIDRLSEERSREVTNLLKSYIEEKKKRNRSLWGRLFGRD